MRRVGHRHPSAPDDHVWSTETASILGSFAWRPALRTNRRFPCARAVMESAGHESVAVLAFGNLSKEADNAFFADGIGAQIAARLDPPSRGTTQKISRRSPRS